MSTPIDYANLPTPPAAVADFCLIPIGTPTASVSNEVAAVQRLMKASGLSYSMHSAGTTVEGSWDEVMRLIGQAHTLVHQNGVLRVQTDIRAGTRLTYCRTDKKQHFSEKVSKVESILAGDKKE
ncbi:cell wall biogenesis protein-like protein Ecm15 [Cadophora sp. DSE1049]|nr:cell wall biogenesis protein-like protein Ecm15 [Cadophora sp. DSE1049]